MAARYKRDRRVFDLSVLGDAELARSFVHLELRLARKILKQELRKAFKPTLRVIKGHVPDELQKVRRGMKLRANKRVRRGSFGFRIFTPGLELLNTRQIQRPGSRGGKGKQGYFPMSWEAGWTFPNGRRMQPRSFMRVGFRSEKPQIVSRLRRGLRDRIRSEAKKLGGARGLRKAARSLG